MKTLLSLLCHQKGKKGVPARFTVEASLLMLLIIPLLIALIIAGFYIHDRAYLQGVSCEMIAEGSNLQQYKNRDSLLKKQAAQRVTHTLVWSRSVQSNISCSEDSVSCICSGSFPVPGLAARLLDAQTLYLSQNAERRLLHPADLIWKIRSAKFVLEQITA